MSAVREDVKVDSASNPFITLETQYSLGDFVGKGMYGTVIQAVDNRNCRKVAIKHLSLMYESPDATKHVVRELFLLNSLRHENIVFLHNLNISSNNIFIITEYCEFDLHKITYPDRRGMIYKKSCITSKSDYVYILYQIITALQFMHSRDVIHRDIKPGNILLKSDLTVKLCDFGFARVVHNCGSILPNDAPEPLTEYMVTRFYRAPEVFLNPRRYGKAQDIWSAACAFAEVIRRYPLFPGKTSADQIQVIVDVLGKPSEEDLDFPMSARASRFVRRLKATGSSSVGGGAGGGEGLDHALKEADVIRKGLFTLLERMLKFNPHHRITADDALSVPIFEEFRPAMERMPIEYPSWEIFDKYVKSVVDTTLDSERLEIVQDLVRNVAEHMIDRQMDNEVLSALLEDDVDEAHQESSEIRSMRQLTHRLSASASASAAHSGPMSVMSMPSNGMFAGLNSVWSLTSKLSYSRSTSGSTVGSGTSSDAAAEEEGIDRRIAPNARVKPAEPSAAKDPAGPMSSLTAFVSRHVWGNVESKDAQEPPQALPSSQRHTESRNSRKLPRLSHLRIGSNFMPKSVLVSPASAVSSDLNISVVSMSDRLSNSESGLSASGH